MSEKKKWKIDQDKDLNVITVEFPDVKAGWEQWWMVAADRHWDNPKSNRRMQKAHLELAKQRNAIITEIGDTYCCMEGRFDPRRTNVGVNVRSEHQKSDYLGALTRTAVDWFSPYAENYAMFGYGNHETACLKNNSYDLIRNLTDGLNDKNGTNIHRGGYNGYLRFRFRIQKTRTQTINAFYTHGSGGGGPVTKGVIQTNRRAVWNPDANIIMSGHIHEQWIMPLPRYRLSNDGVPYHDYQVHVQLPTYKEEYHDGKEGWHVERGAPPKPLGCQWFRFYFLNEAIWLDTPMSFPMSTGGHMRELLLNDDDPLLNPPD